MLLFLLPPASHYEGYSLCLFYNLFGIKCPTCGMTRAFANAFHLDFGRAAGFNPLIFLFFPTYWVIFLGDVAALILMLCGRTWVSPAEWLIMKIDRRMIRWT